MELCRIMDYCYGKSPLNFGCDTTQNSQLVDVFGFFDIKQIVGDAGLGGVMCAAECLLVCLILVAHADVCYHI